MSKEKELNIKLTFIVELLEVINRIIYDTVDNPALKHILKKDFNKILKEGKRLDKDYRKYISQDERFEDAEEMFDTDVDGLYDLIMATRTLATHEQWIKAISSVKMIK